MNLKRLFVVALLGLSVLAAGCGRPTKQTVHKVKVSEVVHSIFYAPMYVAANKGFWKEEGLEVELTTILGADKGAAALLSGDVDFALFGPEAAVYIRQQGAAQPIKAIAQVTARDGSFLVARQPMPNFKWTDTKGKTVIGGRKGGIPQMTLESLMRRNGFDPQKDTNMIQNIALNATAGAFSSGTGDFVQLWEPGPTQLEKAGVGHVVASLGKDHGPMPYTVFHAAEKTLKEKPEITQKFVNGLYKAMLWIKDHSAKELAEVLKPNFPEADQAVLTTAFERYKAIGAWSETPVFNEENYNNLIKLLTESGELKGTVAYKDVVDTTFAEQAVKQVKK